MISICMLLLCYFIKRDYRELKNTVKVLLPDDVFDLFNFSTMSISILDWGIFFYCITNLWFI